MVVPYTPSGKQLCNLYFCSSYFKEYSASKKKGYEDNLGIVLNIYKSMY